MTQRIAVRIAEAVAVSVFLSAPALAEPPQDPHGIFTFQAENDAASTLAENSDRYYTSGLKLGYTTGTTGVPAFLSNFGRSVWGDGVQRISFDLSQSIFTPRNTQENPPNPRDRPYAGYLRLSGALIHDSDAARSVLGISLGVVGPSALARQVQNGFHDIIGDRETKGWSSQLKDEPAIELLAERTWRLPVTSVGPLEVDTLPALTMGVGTVRDYVQGGASVRVGQGLGSDFGVTRIRPGLSGNDPYTPTRPLAWYVFAGVDGQAIARDVFLDGSTFRSNSPHVSKLPYLGEVQAGLAVMLYGVRLSYTQVWQTQSFYGQKGGWFSFGSFAAGVRF